MGVGHSTCEFPQPNLPVSFVLSFNLPSSSLSHSTELLQLSSMDQFISDFLSGKNFQQLASNILPYYSTFISKARNFLTQETLTAFQKALREGKMKDVVDIIQKSLEEAENTHLDVVVIGESGTGKSSFIKALRGLSHEEEGSASVGVVDTTLKKTPYQHP